MTTQSSRRNFMKQAAGTALAGYFGSTSLTARGLEAGGSSSGATVFLEPFDYSGVRLSDGMLKRQCDAARDFYFNLSDDDILKGFRHRAGLASPGNQLGGWYGGDPQPAKDWPDEWPRFVFSRGDMFNAFGQWLSGMARMSKATGDVALQKKATGLMLEWAKTIEPEGYFYYSRNPIAPHYTYEKTICGLIDLYEYGNEKEALPVLERITEWATANLDRARVNPSPEAASGVGGCEWYTLCENLYRAYQLTGDSKYKNFGDLWRYERYWSMFSDTSEPTPYHLHAYSHCNTLSSAAMTYRVTADPKYLRTIVNAYDWFDRTQFYATGGYGPGEQLMAPDGSLGKSLETNADTFETPCGSWACFKLGKYLMQFTGEARYGDWMERVLYNGIGAALPMERGGKTFYYSDYRIGGARKVYFPAAFPCCSGTYIQAVADYHNIIYFRNRANLYVNLFVPSAVTWQHDDAEVSVVQETIYPESDTTVLSVSPTRSASFGLNVRIPKWCEAAEVSLNGRRHDVTCEPGKWATIQRRWSQGDRVSVRFPMRLNLSAIDPQHSRRVAMTYGPIVLVRLHEQSLIPGAGAVSDWVSAGTRPLEFRALNQPSGSFVPFYKLPEEVNYTMYFDLPA